MITVPRFVVAILGISLLLPIVPAAAGHFAGSCAVELNAVELAITDANFLGSRAATNESNLLAKLQAAAGKLAQDKPSDAIDKLQDISDAATALANAAKPKLEDATAINGAVTAAIGCAGTL